MRLLGDGWRLGDFSPGRGVQAGAHLPDYDDHAWLPVGVPGDVHRALIAAGRIPDPFYGRNETACAWMEDREWWYRLAFNAEPGRLVFHGLDTFATLYLDGEQIGEHRNMFRPAIFDVAHGQHVLAVRFDPPLRRIQGLPLSLWGRNPERTAMRKAQFGFGWDWGPRLPSIGIWQPVELVPARPATLRRAHFVTLDLARDGSRAAVAVRVEVEQFAQARLTARIRLGEIEHELDLQRAATAYLTVDQPRLWWTHDLGEPALYDLSVTLFDDDTPIDAQTQRVGIRTLSLDQSPDPAEPGTRFFRFVLNGQPIFARGADWAPCDAFLGVIPPERYTRLLEAARDANMTMLRVWGGGIYEADHFYAECDRLGVLVWQDFMFACAMYPETPDFIAEVDAEARHQVRRLRSHPCLAVWCGNNENQWIHERQFWDRRPLPAYGAVLYDEVLPRAVADLDGSTPYWPGTPYGGSDHNSPEQGNVHNWQVWHGNLPRRFGEPPRRDTTPEGVSFVRYAEDPGRFVSEFGMHAAPALETLRRVVPRPELYRHSPTLDWHNKDDPKDKGDNLLLTSTGLPGDLAEYILFSQIAQAEGLKFGIEHYRRRKPHCSGTLVWQLDDCWPALSWSLIDYYGFFKAGYWFLKRAYAPVLASFKGNELWLTNDTLTEVQDQVTVRLGTFDGRVLWDQTSLLSVAANASQAVWRLPVEPGPERYLSVQSASGVFPPNRAFFSAIKDLVRQRSAPLLNVTREGAHALRAELTAPSDAYVYFAHLTTRFESTQFSDNYLDLQPGQTTCIQVTDPHRELTSADLTLGCA